MLVVESYMKFSLNLLNVVYKPHYEVVLNSNLNFPYKEFYCAEEHHMRHINLFMSVKPKYMIFMFHRLVIVWNISEHTLWPDKYIVNGTLLKIIVNLKAI